jgi:outer membrane receptor protein involved in Fe transport
MHNRSLLLEWQQRWNQSLFQFLRRRVRSSVDVGYQLSRNWQVALNVNNVFDKRYYLSEDTPSATFWYGEPRNFMLRIDAKY